MPTPVVVLVGTGIVLALSAVLPPVLWRPVSFPDYLIGYLNGISAVVGLIALRCWLWYGAWR